VNVQDDSEDLTAELLPELSEFNTSVDINKFLAYIANQLLDPPRRSRQPLPVAPATRHRV